MKTRRMPKEEAKMLLSQSSGWFLSSEVGIHRSVLDELWRDGWLLVTRNAEGKCYRVVEVQA